MTFLEHIGDILQDCAIICLAITSHMQFKLIRHLSDHLKIISKYNKPTSN